MLHNQLSKAFNARIPNVAIVEYSSKENFISNEDKNIPSLSKYQIYGRRYEMPVLSIKGHFKS